MWKLRQFGVDCAIVHLSSTFCVVARHFLLSVNNKTKLGMIVHISRKIVGQQQHSMLQLCETRVAGKERAVLSYESRLLYREYGLLPSGWR